MSDKKTYMRPTVMNAMSLGATNNIGDADHLVMSQKGASEILNRAGAFEDAPFDDKLYARKNGVWVEIIAVEEAPSDGKSYVRKNGAWVEV